MGEYGQKAQAKEAARALRQVILWVGFPLAFWVPIIEIVWKTTH